MSSEEKLLLKKAIKGDIESFERLIEKYQVKAYNIALRMMGNEEDAKDTLQDAWIKIYKSLKKFRQDSSFYTWIYRIVTNTCHDALKKRNRINQVTSLTDYSNSFEGEINDIKDEVHIPERIFENKEYTQLLLESLDKLSTDHKQIIILRDVQGFSYEEISQIMACSEGTVKSRLSRARIKLKEIISQDRSMEQI
ncbi:MAG: RNA polymerase sigma factor [Clostridia bacterium]|nr:RNA polymerase sigma factor [Clostridia bacterium]